MTGLLGKMFRTSLLLLVAAALVAAAPLRPAALQPARRIPPLLPGFQTCPNPLGVVQAFLDHNDAAEYDASLALLTSDVSLVSWAEGVNGRHWSEIHLSGQEHIRPRLAQRGLRRLSGLAGEPLFFESEIETAGNRVSLMLRPDRLGPRGQPYNPYKLEAHLRGCKIQSLAVVMFFTVP